MKSCFIVNPNSGGGKGLKIWNSARNYMVRHGYDHEIFFTAASGDAATIARDITEAAQGEPVNIFVIGGEGTYNEVLNGLQHLSNVNMGFIPTAPSEGCAKSLRLSANPKKILRSFYETGGNGRIEAMDYGVLTCENGEIIRRFAGSCGIGYDASDCQRIRHGLLSPKTHLLRSPRLEHFAANLKELLFGKAAKGYILLDSTRRIEFNNLVFVSVHIHPFEGKYRFGTYADPKDGMLEVCAVNCRKRFRLLQVLFKGRFRGFGNSSRVRLYQCKEAHIHFEKPMAIHVDGAVVRAQTDIDLRCIRQQLNVLR